jgi:hypothetical protein
LRKRYPPTDFPPSSLSHRSTFKTTVRQPPRKNPFVPRGAWPYGLPPYSFAVRARGVRASQTVARDLEPPTRRTRLPCHHCRLRHLATRFMNTPGLRDQEELGRSRPQAMGVVISGFFVREVGLELATVGTREPPVKSSNIGNLCHAVPSGPGSPRKNSRCALYHQMYMLSTAIRGIMLEIRQISGDGTGSFKLA